MTNFLREHLLVREHTLCNVLDQLVIIAHEATVNATTTTGSEERAELLSHVPAALNKARSYTVTDYHYWNDRKHEGKLP